MLNPTTAPSVVLNNGGRKIQQENKKRKKYLDNVHYCRWGSSLPGLRTRDPPLSPPSTWAEFFRHTCLQSHLPTSPPTPQKSYPKFQNPRTNFEIFNFNFFFKPKNDPQGARGGLQIFWGVNISFFCENKPPVKFQNSNWPTSKKIFKKNLNQPWNRPPGGQGVGVRILFFSQNFYYLF